MYPKGKPFPNIRRLKYIGKLANVSDSSQNGYLVQGPTLELIRVGSSDGKRCSTLSFLPQNYFNQLKSFLEVEQVSLADCVILKKTLPTEFSV